jgi:hypothetical protein
MAIESVAKSVSRVVAMVALTTACTASAGADSFSFDFSDGTTGNLETSTLSFFDGEGGTELLRVTGFYFDGSTWQPGNLYRRHQPNDNGLGVCSPSDEAVNGGECPGPEGGGDFNELDNSGQPELILLELVADGYEFVSVGLSSLDTNGGTDPESGRLWFAGSADPLLRFGSFLDFVGSDANREPVFPQSEFPVVSRFLFFEPMDVGDIGEEAVTTSAKFDNDFLVRSAVITQQTAVPEPSSLLALGAGLAILGLRVGRRSTSQRH